MGPQMTGLIGKKWLSENQYLTFLYCSHKRQRYRQGITVQKTPVANLVRNTASRIYYARMRLRGKLIWKSLKTSFPMLEQVTLGAPWRIRMAKQFEDLIVAQAPATRYSP